MTIKPPNNELLKYLQKHQLAKKFNKAAEIFIKNPYHPSLRLELLEPKHLKIYSFRLDIKFRAIFIITDGEAEIIAITNHYK